MVSSTVVLPDHRTCSGIWPTFDLKYSSMVPLDALKSIPSNIILPSSIGIIPAKILSKVVFPAPFGPTNPRIFPVPSERLNLKIPGPLRVFHGLVNFGFGILWRNEISINSITSSAMMWPVASTMTN